MWLWVVAVLWCFILDIGAWLLICFWFVSWFGFEFVALMVQVSLFWVVQFLCDRCLLYCFGWLLSVYCVVDLLGFKQLEISVLLVALLWMLCLDVLCCVTGFVCVIVIFRFNYLLIVLCSVVYQSFIRYGLFIFLCCVLVVYCCNAYCLRCWLFWIFVDIRFGLQCCLLLFSLVQCVWGVSGLVFMQIGYLVSYCWVWLFGLLLWFVGGYVVLYCLVWIR